MSDRIRQILVLLFAIAEAVAPFLVYSSFNQLDDGGTSPDYFIPSEGTFAVWGLIFSSSLAYGIYQALPSQRMRSVHRRVGPWLGANYLLAAIWMPFSVQPAPIFTAITAVIIVGMLVTLTITFIRLRQMYPELTRRDRWLVQVPAMIYFAWINVATVANTTAALVDYGITGEPYGAIWSSAMIVIATIIVSSLILYNVASEGTIAFAGVIVWALVGIFIGNGERSSLVAAASLGAAAVIILVTVFRFLNRRFESAQRRALA